MDVSAETVVSLNDYKASNLRGMLDTSFCVSDTSTFCHSEISPCCQPFICADFGRGQTTCGLPPNALTNSVLKVIGEEVMTVDNDVMPLDGEQLFYEDKSLRASNSCQGFGGLNCGLYPCCPNLNCIWRDSDQNYVCWH